MTMVDDDIAVYAERLLVRHPNKTYAAGRICKTSRCRTILSIYNVGPWCSVHESVERKLRPWKASDFLRGTDQSGLPAAPATVPSETDT
jgi:hypothetical protein